MTFYGTVRQDPLAILFIGLSALTFLQGLRLGGVIRQRWTELQREPLLPWQKQLLDRAAFYLAIPLGVFVHEFFHALATWLFGGKIVDAGYAFYFGYVVPDGQFTLAQYWFIALAGTIGSLVYGVVVWSLFRRSRLSSYRYFGLRVLWVHLFYSLVFYPLFSVLTGAGTGGGWGDWATIYKFKATPFLSGATLLVHLGALALIYGRQDAFQMPAFEGEADMEQFDALKTRAAANPQDAEARLKLADAYRRSGMTNLAKKELSTLLRYNSRSAEAYVQLAAIHSDGKRQVPKRARDEAERALAFGLTNPQAIAFANMLVGQYNIGVGQVDQAISHYAQGIEAARQGGNASTVGRLYYLRAVAYRRRGDFAAAQADIQEAIARAQHADQGQLLKHYEAEQEAIRQESNYQR
jgi:tetratricopeptide (TPR) repeat protein